MEYWDHAIADQSEDWEDLQNELDDLIEEDDPEYDEEQEDSEEFLELERLWNDLLEH